jgi:hypothetical protein
MTDPRDDDEIEKKPDEHVEDEPEEGTGPDVDNDEVPS